MTNESLSPRYFKASHLFYEAYNAVAVEGGSGKVGYLVEFDQTSNIFNNPKQEATQEYVSGRFG